MHMSEADIGKKVIIRFQVEKEAPNIKRVFPNAIFDVGTSLIDTICNFLTSDILITDGSSLVYVAAFAPFNNPLIIEEERKEAIMHMDIDKHKIVKGPMKGIRQSHIFSKNNAILLLNGVPILSLEEYNFRIRSHFKEIYNM